MLEADLIVLGAGPAGMAAAARAADLGLSVLLLDEQPRAGGQIYRDVGRASAERKALLGADYAEGAGYVAALSHPGITHLTGASVWRVDPDGRVAFSRDGQASLARGRRLLIATGAMERPMTVPGWQCPGVMTAGAAQILLKSSGLVPEQAVLAGSGPLLYLVAAQMIRAGARPLALIETRSQADTLAASRHAAGALIGAGYLRKGLGLMAELRRAGLRIVPGAADLRIEGAASVTALQFRANGQAERLECQGVFLHHGVIPNTQMTRALGLEHVWSAPNHAFAPKCDAFGRSSDKTVFVAGDGAGIGGAKTAALSGQIAAIQIACDLGALSDGDRDLMARPLRLRRRLDLAARPFLDRAFPPYAAALLPADGTVICRCEEVTAGQIRQAAALGCLGPAQAKVFTRAGMGPCQGRTCGPVVTQILADCHGQPPERIGSLRIRSPLKPVTLGELAQLAR